MAVFDAFPLFSVAFGANGTWSGQAANGAGNILSTNTVDLGPQTGNQLMHIARGEELQATFRVLTAPTVGTSIRFQLIQADDAALSSNVQVLGQSDDIPIASLPAGAQVIVRPGNGLAPKRYFGARYVNTGAIATFSVMAGLLKDSQSPQTSFQSGFGVA